MTNSCLQSCGFHVAKHQYYSYALRDAVNSSALESWEDEFTEGNIAKAPSRLVRPPRVADSPVSFECRVHSIVRVSNEHHGEGMFGGHLVGNSDIVIGRVLGIHVKGEYISPEGVSRRRFCGLESCSYKDR
jgi:flavin reductase (DIM6/NTAB) family NADH-FMN oxidoreductase RutF